jgi:hypothetical protein
MYSHGISIALMSLTPRYEETDYCAIALIDAAIMQAVHVSPK